MFQVVEESCSKVKTRIIEADFTGKTHAEFYAKIREQVKDLDISIVINNAGVMHNGYFELITAEKIS